MVIWFLFGVGVGTIIGTILTIRILSDKELRDQYFIK
jgi:predicted small secreted protein